MKAAPKTPKAKRQEEQANFISWRFALLCGCILLALAFLLGRVAWLQVISPDMLVRQGDMRSLRVQEVSTARGMITDRSGRPLAVSVPVKAIWADPKELHDAGGVTLDTRWKALADALNMPLDQLTLGGNTVAFILCLICPFVHIFQRKTKINRNTLFHPTQPPS